MKKLLILLTLVLTTSACSVDSTPVTSKDAKDICIDGVTYITFWATSGDQGFGFMSVKLGKDSKVILCDNSGE